MFRTSRKPLLLSVLLFVVCTNPVSADDDLTASLRQLDARVLTHERAEPTYDAAQLRSMISADLRARRRSVNEADVKAWRSIASREEWEQLRDVRIAALKNSLGRFPDPPEDLHVRITKTLTGDGFHIDCLVFASRPQLQGDDSLLVTANLYRPAKPSAAMPGILICHSHHNPKTQSELQDMGVLWARAGCLVLVMDQVGHGERRQHPFRSSADYEGDFRASRQDYYFRYNVGIHLHLIGDSLMGWMAWDLMRGVDLLLDQEGIDPERIILLGAVAGGGDPAAVTVAIDKRIKAAVPFNFGGPQPESVFPLPVDAQLSFNYTGGGSWESTRNLRRSARDGFLPWTIVAATAPRALIYAHEFKWDRDNDPVWKRLESIYEMYDRREFLAGLKGYGAVTLSSNEASHCNNIGPHHRAQIHPLFQRWFDLQVSIPEFRDRRAAQDLLCANGGTGNGDGKPIVLPLVHKLAGAIADQRLAAIRRKLQAASPVERVNALQTAWSEVLGGIAAMPVTAAQTKQEDAGPCRVIRFSLNTEREILVPGLLLLPPGSERRPTPVVVAFAQAGKRRFLTERADGIARLLEAGVAVCLPDLRGTGETRPGDYRGRRSNATGLSSSELMLGGTLLGSRLNDLLTVIHWLRTRPDVNGSCIAVWGDSFAKVNSADRRIEVPLGIDDEPHHSEPLGATLALLAGLFDQDLKAVAARGGLVSIRSVLDSPFVYIPHDYVIPGSLTAGDLTDLAVAVGPRALRVEGMVTGTNRRAVLNDQWQQVAGAFASSPDKLFLAAAPRETMDAAKWLVAMIQATP